MVLDRLENDFSHSSQLAMIEYVLIFLFVLSAIFAHKLRYPGSDLHKLPGPRPLPLIGSALDFILTAEEIIPTIQALQKKYGQLFLIWLGLTPSVHILSPEGAEALLTNKKNIEKGRAYQLLRPWLGEGLLTSHKHHWAAHRRLITPTFHFTILENFLAVFEENARILVKCLHRFALSGSPMEIGHFVTRCTLDVMAESAMGVKINAQMQNEDGSFYDERISQYIEAINAIAETSNIRMINPIYRPDFLFYRTPMGKSFAKHLKTAHEFTEHIIRTRRQESKEPNGERSVFLDLLLKTRDEDGQPLSDTRIREEVDTLMAAGHDTTASSVMWTLYLLSKNPEIQEGILQELQEIFKDDEERSVTLADLSQMKYLERAIKEELRIYPSVASVGRTITDEMDIEGYKMPVGTSVGVHIYQLHRNPEIFPDPEKFDPDRFLPENSQQRHQFAYVPFSAGPRNCIGQRFAMLEAKVILSEILRAYQVQFVGELRKDLIKVEITLRPPPGMWFRLIARKKSLVGDS